LREGSTDYAVVKVSTFAMDDEIRKYVKWSDAVGYCYQQLGHTFYQIDFPAADKSWVLDLSNGEWAQYSSIDINGVHHRHKGFLSAYAYNTNVMLDWQNGTLYAQDPDTFTDDSLPIVCIRGIPHLGGAGNLISYPGIIADFDAGNIAGVTSQAGNPWSAGFSSAFGPFFQPDTNEPLVRMRFSATRGNTFGNPRQRSLGATGQYNRILKWDSCGSARDGVFEFEWAVPAKTWACFYRRRLRGHEKTWRCRTTRVSYDQRKRLAPVRWGRHSLLLGESRRQTMMPAVIRSRLRPSRLRPCRGRQGRKVLGCLAARVDAARAAHGGPQDRRGLAWRIAVHVHGHDHRHLLITGGNVSAVLLTRGLQSAACPVSGFIPMAAKDSVTITYTVAPTLTFHSERARMTEQDQIAFTQAFHRWCKGNESAMKFCADMVEVAHVWDDLVDGDKAVPAETADAIFRKLLLEIPAGISTAPTSRSCIR
jgi:hypothetical protein